MKGMEMSTQDARVLFCRCLRQQKDHLWSEFLDRFGTYLQGVVLQAARRRLPYFAKADLEGLVQDVYCRLLRQPPSKFDHKSDPEFWSYVSRTAIHLVIDRQRAFLRQRQELAEPRTPSALSWANPKDRQPEDTPEDRLLHQDRYRRLLHLASEVVRPGHQRVEVEALRLALLEGYSSREIACASRGHLRPQRVDRLVYRFRCHLHGLGLGPLPRRTMGPARGNPRRPCPDAESEGHAKMP